MAEADFGDNLVDCIEGVRTQVLPQEVVELQNVSLQARVKDRILVNVILPLSGRAGLGVRR
jgi:hypothetical protein